MPEDKPSANDRRRRIFDFQRMIAAQQVMMSPHYGQHLGGLMRGDLDPERKISPDALRDDTADRVMKAIEPIIVMAQQSPVEGSQYELLPPSAPEDALRFDELVEMPTTELPGQTQQTEAFATIPPSTMDDEARDFVAMDVANAFDALLKEPEAADIADFPVVADVVGEPLGAGLDFAQPPEQVVAPPSPPLPPQAPQPPAAVGPPAPAPPITPPAQPAPAPPPPPAPSAVPLASPPPPQASPQEPQPAATLPQQDPAPTASQPSTVPFMDEQGRFAPFPRPESNHPFVARAEPESFVSPIDPLGVKPPDPSPVFAATGSVAIGSALDEPIVLRDPIGRLVERQYTGSEIGQLESFREVENSVDEFTYRLMESLQAIVGQLMQHSAHLQYLKDVLQSEGVDETL